MSIRSALGIVLCALVLIRAPGLAGRVRGAEVAPPKDPDALVALMAGEDLAVASGKRSVSRTPGARAAAALVEMKGEAVPALGRALGSGDFTIRLNAVYVLGRIGTPATLAARIKAASDAHPRVRAAAVRGLPAYDGGEARRAVLSALKDPDGGVREAAVRAFGRFDEKEMPGNAVRFATANVLIPLLDDPGARYAAAETLGQLGMNVAARPLLKLLGAQESGVRTVAVQALGRLKDKQVAVELTAALRDEDSYVRTCAVQALGRIGDLRTTPALVGMLWSEEAHLRRDAASALGEIGDLRSVPGLLAVLGDADEQVRSAAAEALGRIGDVRAVGPLCGLLNGGGREGASASTALGRLGDARAVGPLTRYLLGPRPGGAREAAAALARIRHPDSVAGLVKVILESGSDTYAGQAARQGLGEVAGVSFSHEPAEKVAEWWARNREDYSRGVPESK